ncbi:4-phosphoerythronate dehydrogenase PdxB [Thalassolituus sp.]|uniref:4-phosphoerythronate dehydrogenase PdxB n=1 Tax=Thalassolituus sp. TaxID=2030822 RepID=UPI00351329EC
MPQWLDQTKQEDSTVHIVADENIPLIEQFFGEFGEITRLPGRSMKASDLSNADILLVRSVTEVDASLLAGTPVKFVGTATIGTDHIDTEYLDSKGIGFASAPGCNAQAVVDYVLSALSVIVDSRGIEFADLSVGIVGVGNVGLLLRQRLEQMGMTVRATDPFKDEEDVGELTSLDDVLSCDVVSLHTPLERGGEHPTWHLINEARLKQMAPDACLLNACRGAVVDNAALSAHLKQAPDFVAILDVWENEPELDLELMELCSLATPHIAGYSLDGKMKGTELIYQAACGYFGLPVRLKLGQFLPEPGIRRVDFSAEVPIHQALRTAIRASYEIRVDDGVMRSVMRRSQNLRESFDRMRKDYPLRRDTINLRVGVPSRAHDLQDVLEATGFDVRSK